MIGLTLVSPPATEPVTLNEAKAHLRVDTADDDALIGALVVAARQWAERYTGRALIAQNWRMTLDDWPEESELYGLALPKPPLIAISDVQVYSEDDAATLWNSNNYFVDSAVEPGRIAPRSAASWPVPGRRVSGIAISFSAGYGANATDVPEAIRLAIKQLAAHWYEHRGEAIAGSSVNAAPMVIEALLAPYRLRSVGL